LAYSYVHKERLLGDSRDMQSGIWQAVLGEIELSISRGNFVTWFKNTRLLRQDSERIVIGVPNVFYKSHMEKKYTALISETLQKIGAGNMHVEFKIQSGLTQIKEEDEPVVLQPSPSVQTKPAIKQQTSSLAHSYRQGLNERYTFDNFV